MADESAHDDEVLAGPTVSMPVSPSKTRTSLSKIPPQLSEKEFASAAARKLLREELERADAHILELKEELKATALELKESELRFHNSDKQVTELMTEARASQEAQTLRSLCLIMGSVLIGLTTAGWLSWPGQAIVGGVGLLFIAGGLLTRRSSR
jgi:hypothetical protein